MNNERDPHQQEQPSSYDKKLLTPLTTIIFEAAKEQYVTAHEQCQQE